MSTAVRPTWSIEAELEGVGLGWTRLSDVKGKQGARWSRGINGSGVLDLVAEPGMLRWTLDNSEANSARARGYYAFDNSMCRAGWDLGIRVRLLLEGATQFIGWLDDAKVESGIYGPREVPCVAVDWMEQASRWPITGLATMTNTTPAAVFSAIVGAVPVQPSASYADPRCDDVYPYALDSVRNESSTALAEFGRLAASELGYIYVLRDGTVSLASRQARTSPVPLATLVPTESAYGYQAFTRGYDGRGSVINRVRATVNPRSADVALSVLFTLQEVMYLASGESRVIVAGYSDPSSKSTRVGGTGMISPVATTDYAANAAADGSGAPMTASLTVTPDFGGDAASLTVTNGHASAGLYITLLRLRGLGLYAYEPVTIEAVNAASRAKYGEVPLKVNMAYQGTSTFARAVADGLASYYSTRRPATAQIRFAAVTPELLDLAATIDVSSCLAIEDEMGGNGVWFINGLDFAIDSNGYLQVTATVVGADVSAYWHLNIDQLGVTTKLKAF